MKKQTIKLENVNRNRTFACNIYKGQYFGKFLPINKNKTIESVLAGSKLH